MVTITAFLYTSFVLVAFFQETCAVALGGTCDGGNTCATEHASCIDSACKCQTGYKQEADACKKELQQACNEVTECLSNTVCADKDGGKKCHCKELYKESDGVCVKLIETPCTGGNADCKEPNSECDNAAGGGAKCKCSHGYKLSTDSTSCVKMTVIETPCTGGNADCKEPNSECDNAAGGGAKCKCSDGYKLSTDSTSCVKKSVSDTVCTVEGTECNSIDNAECDATGSNTGKCKCKDGFTMSVDKCNSGNIITISTTVFLISLMAMIHTFRM